LRVFTPLQAAEYAEVEASIEKTLNDLRSRHLRVHSETVLGYPTEKIIEYAESQLPDLIVMGAKGHDLLGGLPGSVVMNVVC
jgi:nucleotide-binding universal stress UspA family protein